MEAPQTHHSFQAPKLEDPVIYLIWYGSLNCFDHRKTWFTKFLQVEQLLKLGGLYCSVFVEGLQQARNSRFGHKPNWISWNVTWVWSPEIKISLSKTVSCLTFWIPKHNQTLPTPKLSWLFFSENVRILEPLRNLSLKWFVGWWISLRPEW